MDEIKKPDLSAEMRWALWDELGRQIEHAEQANSQARSSIEQNEKRIAWLKKGRLELSPSPCKCCDGRGWNVRYDEFDSRSHETCERCKGTRSAPLYEWEKQK